MLMTVLVKLEAVVKIYSGILSTSAFQSSHQKAASELTSMLLHQYPKVRNAAVDALFLQYPECPSLRTIDWAYRKGIKREDIKIIRTFIKGTDAVEQKLHA